MSETKARRQDRRTAVTTAAILDAAEGLFAERGFHAVTVDAIAEAAGLAVGSIYHHFKNKERLYLALVERALSVNEQAMAVAFGQGRTPWRNCAQPATPIAISTYRIPGTSE